MFALVDMSALDEEAHQVQGKKPLAEGSYGCIYHEEDAPPCKSDRAKGKGDKRKVRKVLEKEDAKIELSIAKLIHSIPLWEYYFVVQEKTGCTETNFRKARPMYEGFCKIFKKTQNSNLVELESPYRGISLRNLRITESFLVESLKHMLTALSLLHKQGICHFDIHAGNILEENGFLRLIDFGSAFKSDYIDKEVIHRHSYMFTSDFPTQPPELSIQNGIYHNLSVEYCIDELLENREVFRNGLPYTGITTFYVKSKLSLIGNYIGTTEAEWVAFYKKHWKKFDTWSVGVVFFNILKQCMLLPSFRPVWKKHQTLITTVLRGCLEPHPTCRFSSEEALSYFSSDALAPEKASVVDEKIPASFF